MLNPRALTHAQLAAIVADVQAILWQESRMLPDDPRQYGEYWNPGKEDDGEALEQSGGAPERASRPRRRPPRSAPTATADSTPVLKALAAAYPSAGSGTARNGTATRRSSMPNRRGR
jgi:hypothetical protein